MWQEWLIAFGLLLVIEGILPALHPRGFRQALELLQQTSEGQLRFWGLASMMAGALLVYLAH